VFGKPLPAPGSEPDSLQGFLHPCARLPGRFLSYLSQLLNFLTSQLRRSPFFSPAPLLPFSLALLFPLLLCLPAVVHAQPTWGPDVRLTYAQWESWWPEIAIWKDSLYVAWRDLRDRSPSSGEVYFKRSLDGGITWSPDVKLSLADSGATGPVIVARHDTVIVAWQDYRHGSYIVIYYRRSTDAGATWGPEVLLSNWWRVSYDPTLALGDGGDVYAVWCDQTTTNKLRFRRSTDYGTTWEPDTLVGPVYAGTLISPTLVFARGVLHLIKDELIPPWAWEVGYRRSTDRGLTWSPVSILSENDSIHSFWPKIAADSTGGVYVSWADYKYSPYPWTGDIFYRRSTDQGLSWHPIQEFVYQHRARGSDVACDSSQVYLTWEDSRNGPNDNFEIYFQMSTDRGTSWGPEARLTYAPYNSEYPRVEAAQGKVHLVWQDARDDTLYNGNFPEIYYKRGVYRVGVERNETLAGISSEIGVEVLSNPFQSEARVLYWLNQEGFIDLSVYNIEGQITRVLKRGISGPGRCRVVWDGLDRYGKEVGSGVYFIRLTAGGKEVTKRVVKLR